MVELPENGKGIVMALLEISVVPVGTGSASFSSQVTDAIKIIQDKGMNYQVTPTATVIEGEIDELMDVAKDIHKHAISNGSDRVITNISIDHRTDKTITMGDQIRSVELSLQ